MEILRIEHPEKHVGPYQGENDPVEWMDSPHNARTGRPGVFDDCELAEKIIDKPDYYFGFKTREQLIAWFHESECQKLAERGYKIARFEASEVYEGCRQIAFNRETAQLLTYEDLK